MAILTTSDNHGVGFVASTTARLDAGLKAVGLRFKRVLRALQLARMLSVLSSLPDERLEEIGVTRQEIPAYARKLMGEDA